MEISVIIATHNRALALRDALADLRGQTIQPSLFEVIVVDNNSSDRTHEIVSELIPSFGGRLKYYFEERQGKTFALNKGISAAQGEILVFTDDDVIFEKDWLSKIHDFARSYDFDAAGGRILPKYPSATPAWVKDNSDLISGPVVSYDYGPEIKGYNQKQMNPLVGANMIVKRQLFGEVGGFNTKLGPGAGTFGDDTELCLRWEKKNKRLYYVGTAVVWHPVAKERMTFGYIARWNMASGKYYGAKEYKMSDKHLVSYGGIPRYLLRKIFEHTLILMFSFLNKRKFLLHWVFLFRGIGIAKACREYHLAGVEGI